MPPQLWIPGVFAGLAIVFIGLALRDAGARPVARKVRFRVAGIFAVVSGFLFFYL